ncbi:helix-turn-helix domain-containing protein [Paenibacillus puerhi]|uniref:helix-turn-helix domain-containing protein n=1 Tax=Paenibacillus puerhi TaxID=2692622 RepID=UPI0013581429|nr:AraC family transcriptional regulator [Paenibacillus puerhi]
MPINKKKPPRFSPILHARSENYFWKGKGALSIKTFKNGRAYYQAGHGHFAVDEGNYLLLNHRQEYSITIESEVPVESFCIFFPENMVEEIYRSMRTSDAQLLDDPVSPKPISVDFVERTYNDKWLAATLGQLKADYTNKSLDRTRLEEKLHELAQGLLQVHRQVNTEIMKLQSLRASTREELYKRIHIGHDFMSAYSDQPISLADVARAACLSPNHFLRSYKQLFGMSPHQFLTERRLQQAKRLLLQTDMSVTDICLEVGFLSPSTFSGLFSKRFSITPSQFRQKK